MSHRPRPAFLIVLIIPLIVVIVAGTWAVIRNLDDPDPPQPTAAATSEPTAVATAEASPGAPEGTPEAGSNEPVPGSLSDLMRYSPDRLADGSLPLPEIATYTDITAWLATQGQVPGTLREDQAAGLALPPVLAGRGLDPVWEARYGFSLAEIDQVLAIGQAPDYVMVLRGNFDPATLNAAWTRSGYQAVALEGTTVWSLSPVPDDRIDLSNPASQPAMGSMNTLYLLDPHTLIATAKYPRMQAVLQVVAGKQPSLAANGDIARLLDLEAGGQRIVSAVIARGELLEQTPSDTALFPIPEILEALDPRTTATPEPEPMPRASLCLVGMLSTPPPEGVATPVSVASPEVTIAMVFPDEDEARLAAALIPNRFATEPSFATGQPYAESLTLAIDTARIGEETVVLRIGARHGTLDWIELIENRDFAFLTWDPDNEP